MSQIFKSFFLYSCLYNNVNNNRDNNNVRIIFFKYYIVRYSNIYINRPKNMLVTLTFYI